MASTLVCNETLTESSTSELEGSFVNDQPMAPKLEPDATSSLRRDSQVKSEPSTPQSTTTTKTGRSATTVIEGQRLREGHRLEIHKSLEPKPAKEEITHDVEARAKLEGIPPESRTIYRKRPSGTYSWGRVRPRSPSSDKRKADME